VDFTYECVAPCPGGCTQFEICMPVDTANPGSAATSTTRPRGDHLVTCAWCPAPLSVLNSSTYECDPNICGARQLLRAGGDLQGQLSLRRLAQGCASLWPQVGKQAWSVCWHTIRLI
jgi:hypothetical protein